MSESTGVKEALAFIGERCQMDRIRLQNALRDLKNLTLEVKHREGVCGQSGLDVQQDVQQG